MKTKKTKIFFAYQNGRGGGAFAMQNLAKNLRKIPGIKITLKVSKPIENWGSIQFLSWLAYTLFFWVKTYARQKNINWVYTSTYTAGVAAALLKPFYKFKICYHYHVSEIPDNPYPSPNSKHFTQNAKVFLIKILHIFFLNSVNMIITPSLFSKRDLKNIFPSINKKNIAIIYNGISPEFFETTQFDTLTKFKLKQGFDKSSIVISYIGRLEKHKNVNKLIEAFKLLSSDKRYKLQIVFITPNNTEEKKYKLFLQNLCHKESISKNIFWVRSPKKLNQYFQISDIVVLPSDSEHLPLVMLEAFASKALFLSTPVGGVNEIISKIDKRLIIKTISPKMMSEQIKQICELGIKQKEIIKNKQSRFAESLTWKKISNQVYQTLISNS